MTDFLPVPEKILKKLHEKGDKNVLYSSFGGMKTSTTPIGKTASMIERTNEELVKKTLEGVNLGSAYKSYSDPFGTWYDWYDIPLKMIKLPPVLIDDNLLKFISVDDDKSEILHFNSSKLNFNEKGEFTIV